MMHPAVKMKMKKCQMPATAMNQHPLLKMRSKRRTLVLTLTPPFQMPTLILMLPMVGRILGWTRMRMRRVRWMRTTRISTS
jgi:hypothetical protein